nr:uncharacterized protein LOC117272995 isoform X2 [Nicotiana tomentosiformis]
MQLIKAHKFQGKYSVLNTWHASKLWINPDLPQAVDFKSSQIPSQRSYYVSDELATGTVEVKTIRELVDCMKEGHIWIVATVVNLLLEKEWSYLGCKRCSKKVDKIGSKFHCKKCDRLDSSATHRYKLQVQVMDRTGFISLLLWDREATNLIGKSANELNESSIEDPDFECEQHTDADTTFKDSMADNEMTYPAKTHAKKISTNISIR